MLDFVGESDGRKDSEGAILKAHDGAASANLYATEAREGNGEGGDGAWDDLTDHHNLCRVRGHEFGSHDDSLLSVEFQRISDEVC